VDIDGIEHGKELILDNCPATTREYLKDPKATARAFPGEPGVFRTFDMYEATQNGSWKYIGRLDDIYGHSTGEKTNPIPFERLVNQSPLIERSALFGRDRPFNILFIQLKKGARPELNEELMNELWELVESANQQTPSYSRVKKSDIIVINADAMEKAIPVTPKGSVIRKQLERLFQGEIELAYNNAGSGDASQVEAIEGVLKLVKSHKETSSTQVAARDLILTIVTAQVAQLLNLDPRNRTKRIILYCFKEALTLLILK